MLVHMHVTTCLHTGLHRSVVSCRPPGYSVHSPPHHPEGVAGEDDWLHPKGMYSAYTIMKPPPYAMVWGPGWLNRLGD